MLKGREKDNSKNSSPFSASSINTLELFKQKTCDSGMPCLTCQSASQSASSFIYFFFFFAIHNAIINYGHTKKIDVWKNIQHT